ncbi:MAG: Alkyl hydroperoxide reductase [Parcubacteria group bacterium]|nr:Alkyl hydroperoxide reductase [Parcubacteria group bacterium]
MYDLMIIGGGPAGVAAAVYAARKQLKTVLIAGEIGGQSTVSEGIENWIGTPKITGIDLGKAFAKHLEAVKSDFVTLAIGEYVTSLEKVAGGFKAVTKTGTEFTAKTVLIASGAGRRKLEVPGADKFENKGVTYCASCDGPLFGGMDVAVIGGGNAGFESALQLLAYSKSVTLVHRSSEFKADPVTVEKARAHPNMRILTNTEPTAVLGEQFVTGLTYKDKNTGEETTLPVSGVFVEIGVIPNTDYAKALVDVDQFGRVKVDARNQRTPVDGVWAAGDCTDELYHQNNIAAGDGVKALEDIYIWIKTHS